MVNILCNGRKKLSSYNIQYSSQGDGVWATACQMGNGIQEMKLIVTSKSLCWHEESC